MPARQARAVGHRGAGGWKERDTRAHNLEYLARRVELGLPRMLRTGDRHGDRWLRDEAARRAAVVRAWKCDVLLGSDDDRERVAASLAPALVRAAEADWGALEQIDDGAQQTNARTGVSVRRLFVAVIPLVAVAAIAASPIPLGSATVEALAAPAIGWLAVEVLRWFGPQETSR